MAPWLFWSALANTGRLSSVAQILLFLPLTLSTLSTPAFLLLSLLLTIHSIIHSTLSLFFPAQPESAINLSALLSFMQIPIHPFLLLLSFNIFSSPSISPSLAALSTLAQYWGSFLRYSGPLFAGLEGLASLVVIQTFGLKAKDLATQSEAWQFSLLIVAAGVYVSAAWWMVLAYPTVATTPLSSSFFGAAITTLFFLTFIGFAIRRTNVIESSGIALFMAYNIWLCSSNDVSPPATPPSAASSWGHLSYAPMEFIKTMLPHFQTLLTFITHTIPKPLLASLMYRLSILHFASRIIPKISGDGWEDEMGVGGGWEGRPTSKVISMILTYRQTIFITVYSHLLLLDHSSQVWWRWTNVFFTLTMWALELLISSDEDADEGLVAGLKEWKSD